MNILIVRLRLIGDVVFTTPVIRALRRRYPDARLVYLVEPSAAPIVRGNPHVSSVVIAPRARGWRRWRDDWRIARDLRRERFDLAIDLHGGPRGAWFTWASRAAVRVGYDVPGRSWMYTRVVARSRSFQPRHAVENQWDLLAAVDPALARPADPSADRVEMPVDRNDAQRVGRTLETLGVPEHHQLVVLHVSAGNPFRRWPEGHFAELAADLVTSARDRSVLVTAGPSDRHAARRVIEAARERAGHAAPSIIDGEGLSLGELRAVVDRAAVFVGGDSGPMHIAATSDVPVVGLYGPTLPVRSAPWRPTTVPHEAVERHDLACRPCDQRVCITHDYRCLTGIPAAAVRDAALRMLGDHP